MSEACLDGFRMVMLYKTESYAVSLVFSPSSNQLRRSIMQTSTTGRAIAPSPGTATSPQLGGVAYERVHLSTRCIIETLFPPHTRGVAFLRGLLTNATVMPYVSPDDSGEVREDLAVVSVEQGCDELRRRVHMAYDTTHMYLVIYRALGLLYEEKRGEQTLFRIPLHP